jgi:DnaJ-class molecular chaperone
MNKDKYKKVKCKACKGKGTMSRKNYAGSCIACGGRGYTLEVKDVNTR